MKSPMKRNKRLSSNKRKHRAAQQSVNYDTLEPRQMLATDLGLNLSGATLGNESSDPVPEVTGDANESFVIQAVNGNFGIYDRTDGVRLFSSSLENFFTAAGGTLFDDLENPQVVYDTGADRWFVAAAGDSDGNWIHVAFSDTSDPTGTWQQLQFAADSTGIHLNDDLQLGVDTDAVYLTTNNHRFGVITALPDNVSIYSIPKSDIFTADPTLTNMSRFEELSPAAFGTTIQVASNFDASDGQAIAVGKTPWEFTGLAAIARTNIVGAGAAGATLSAPVRIFVEPTPLLPSFLPARNPWQPADNLLGNGIGTRDNYRVSIAEANGKLFGAHTVVFDDQDDNTIDRNVINWFEIDTATNNIVTSRRGVQNQTIQLEFRDLFNVSIDVNDYGVVVLNYNSSGNAGDDNGVDQFINFNSTVGITGNGLDARWTQMENIVTIQGGQEDYQLPPSPALWSAGAVRVDSGNPDSGFWGFQTWANTGNRWTAQLTNILPKDLRVVIDGDDGDNKIVFRRNAGNDRLIEVEIDGVVTDLLPYGVLGTVEVRAGAGNDEFLIDYSNGDPVPAGGVVMDGGIGTDTIRTNSPDGVEYLVNGIGSGNYNTTSGFRGIEELVGWTGNDLFRFEGIGSLNGSTLGLGGDDTFSFAGTGGLAGTASGGIGYNTVTFFDRLVTTRIETNSFSALMGYDGRTTGFQSPVARFTAISNMVGSQIGGDRWGVMDRPDSTWVVDDEDSFYTLDAVKLDFSFWDIIDATTFVDTFNVLSNSLALIQLNGQAENDAYNFSSDAPTNQGNIFGLGGLVHANAGAGDNTMVVSNEGGTSSDALVIARRITGFGEIVYDAFGGSFDLKLIGSIDNDTFSLHSFLPSNTLTVESREGDDYFSIQDLSKASVKLFGGTGDDTYAVEKIQGVSFRNLEIVDSVGSEHDRVIIVGTVLHEVFVVTDTTFDDLEVSYIGIEAFGVEGRGGNDVFHVLSNLIALELDGEGGEDVFNFGSDVSAADIISGNIKVDGGLGLNQINLNNQRGAGADVVIDDQTIDGLLANDGVIQYVATGGTFGLREADDFGGIRMMGSDGGDDTIDINGVVSENWVHLSGLGGNDKFYIRAATAANVWAGGGVGDDQYHVFIGAGARTVTAVDSEVGDKNRIEYYGNNGANSVAVTGTGLSSGSDMVATTGMFQFLRVTTFDGQDDLTINGSPALITHFLGGGGDDVMNINNTDGIVGLRGVGHGGMDTFNLNDVEVTTFTRAVGGDANDTFNVSPNARGKVSLDGQALDDTYNVELMRTGFRQVDTRDTGGGIDVTNVMGTNFFESIEVRSTRIVSAGQLVGYSSSIDTLKVDTRNGSDTVEVFASVAPELIVQTGSGNDIVLVSGTSHAQDLKIFGGAGNDIMTVKTTQSTTNLELHGESGADTFNVGSTVSKSNGNLGRIRGEIFVQADVSPDGGTVGDLLYVNDAALFAAYSYAVTPTGVTATPGPRGIGRPNFAGVGFDRTLDTVLVEGTKGSNHFSVLPGLHTLVKIDGNLPNVGSVNADTIKLETADGTLTLTDVNQGNGFWSFTNGNKNVEFKNMELWEQGGALPNLLVSNIGEESSASPLALTSNPTLGVSVSTTGLAGMQESASVKSRTSNVDSEFLRELDSSVEDFDFDFELV